MLCNNIFVKKEIDSELVEEFVAKRKRSVCNRMCSMCKFEVAGGAHIETFTKEYPILNRCTEYDCLARRTMQQIVVRVNSIDEWLVRASLRTCFDPCIRVPDSCWRQVGNNSRDSLSVHRDKSATVQPWNWNNNTVRRRFLSDAQMLGMWNISRMMSQRDAFVLNEDNEIAS